MFSDTCLADRIAILYIFMPRIRADFIDFVHLWNAHHIRSQPNRPSVIHGVPIELYKYPYLHAAQNFAVHVNPDQLRILQDIFKINDHDLDIYLPADTMQVCATFIESIGGLPEILSEEQRATPYINEYEKLRLYLADYILQNKQPVIGLLPKPTNGTQELRDIARRYNLEERVDIDSYIDI